MAKNTKVLDLSTHQRACVRMSSAATTDLNTLSPKALTRYSCATGRRYGPDARCAEKLCLWPHVRTTTVSAASCSTNARQMSAHLLTIPARCLRCAFTMAAHMGPASLYALMPLNGWNPGQTQACRDVKAQTFAPPPHRLSRGRQALRPGLYRAPPRWSLSLPSPGEALRSEAGRQVCHRLCCLTLVSMQQRVWPQSHRTPARSDRRGLLPWRKGPSGHHTPRFWPSSSYVSPCPRTGAGGRPAVAWPRPPPWPRPRDFAQPAPRHPRHPRDPGRSRSCITRGRPGHRARARRRSGAEPGAGRARTAAAGRERRRGEGRGGGGGRAGAGAGPAWRPGPGSARERPPGGSAR